MISLRDSVEIKKRMLTSAAAINLPGLATGIEGLQSERLALLDTSARRSIHLAPQPESHHRAKSEARVVCI